MVFLLENIEFKVFEVKTAKSLFTAYFWNIFANYLVQKGIFLAMKILWKTSRLFPFRKPIFQATKSFNFWKKN